MHAAKEVIWMKNFVDEIRGPQGKAIVIYCDNQGAIALVKDNKFHSQTKHIDLVFEGPVKSGYWVPSSSNRDRDQLGFSQKPNITGPNQH